MNEKTADKNIYDQEWVTELRQQILAMIVAKVIQRGKYDGYPSNFSRLFTASANTMFWCGAGILLGSFILFCLDITDAQVPAIFTAIGVCLLAVGTIQAVVRANRGIEEEREQRNTITREINRLKKMLYDIDAKYGVQPNFTERDINTAIYLAKIDVSNHHPL